MQIQTRSVSRLLGMLAVMGWQTASAVDVFWYRQPGSAVGITSNASGSVWIVGTDRQSTDGFNNGFNVYKWNDTEFVKQNVFAARTLGVTTTDQLWTVNDQNDLFMPLNGSQLLSSTKARDVAVGGDNSVWIIGTDKRVGGYGVYQRTGANAWLAANFGAVRIAIDKQGNAWAVNDAGEIHMYNIATKKWERKQGAKARSVHTGADSGAVWMLGTDSIPGGFPIYQWNASKQAWESYGTYGAVEMTEAKGTPWIVQSDGKLYSKARPSATAKPVNITQTWPIATAQAQPPDRTAESGKLLCSANLSTSCGDTRADYVGKYTLDTSCDTGFYDTIYGGTCWKCPDDDGRGAWIRSLDAVDKDTACWRSPKELVGDAIKVKSPAWAWECPSGSFWDGYSPDGAGGSCWKCPAELPRRTAASVWEWNACASTLNETKRAIFLTYNGCPKPDAATMNLPGKRSPGKPFLDAAAVEGGGCFACPVIDETGNFLITDRNTKPVYDQDFNTGCTTKLKWQPAPFYEPGLAYMQGVKDVIWEQNLFDGARITGYLYDLAEAQGLGDATPDAKAWVTARWQEITARPYNSETLRSFMFAFLKTVLQKKAEDRTAGEKKLIQSFATYIQQRRTYFAEQALAMYDSWKAYDDLYRQETGQSRSLGGLFYYGTVPLDFHGALSGLMTLGAVGGGTIGSLTAANKFLEGAKFVEQNGEFGKTWIRTRESTLYGLTNDLKILKSAQGLAAVSGATVIQVAFAILSSIAIDQFVAIETARPKLEASLALAKQPVDLDVLADSDNEEDTLYLYWSRAMDTSDPEDAQVLQVAAMAQARAEQTGYAAPAKNTYSVSGRIVPIDKHLVRELRCAESG